MQKKLLSKIAVFLLLVAALSTVGAFAGEFESKKYGISLSWHENLVRNKAKETGNTILCVESPEFELALYEFHLTVLEEITEELLFSKEFGDTMLAELKKSTGTTKFESDVEWEIAGYPARKFLHKVTAEGETFWAESIVIVAKGKTFHILGLGDINNKQNFQKLFADVLMTLSIE